MKFLKQVFRPAQDAIRQYGVPFLVIQLCAAAVVVAYYRSTEFQNFCEHISRWKTEGGFLFAAWTTAFAGGIFPEIIKSITGKARRPLNAPRIKDIFFNTGLYATLGVLFDLLYRTQSLLFGDGIDFGTLSAKVFVDLFIAEPFFLSPYVVLSYFWYQNNFDVLLTLRQINLKSYHNRVLPILFPLWLYWIPAAFCIYALPFSLQLPFLLCLLSAWSLIMIFIAKEKTAH